MIYAGFGFQSGLGFQRISYLQEDWIWYKRSLDTRIVLVMLLNIFSAPVSLLLAGFLLNIKIYNKSIWFINLTRDGLSITKNANCLILQ